MLAAALKHEDGGPTSSIEASRAGLLEFVYSCPQVLALLRFDHTGVLCQRIEGVNREVQIVWLQTKALYRLWLRGGFLWWGSDNCSNLCFLRSTFGQGAGLLPF